MKIREIRDDVISIRSEIRNAFINFSEMTVSVAAVISDVDGDGGPLVGFGFNSNGRYAQQGILRDRMIPRLLAVSPESLLDEQRNNLDPFKAWDVMMSNEKPGGHGERSVAVGVLDMALWDLVAKVEEKPLFQLLAERFRDNGPDPDVPVYAAGGYYYPGKGTTQLQSEIQGYLDSGYTDVKIKIGGASLDEDRRRIESILKLLPPGGALAVDANGRFDEKTALDYAEALNQYELKWYEEPGDPLDFEILKSVCSASKNSVATGENLFSEADSRNLIRYGGLSPESDFLQMDPVLSYGLVEYLRILKMLEKENWSWRCCVPHGGHQFALHIAAGLGLGGNESYPGIFKPFGGFADDVPVIEGRTRLPEIPGIGMELKAELKSILDRLAA